MGHLLLESHSKSLTMSQCPYAQSLADLLLGAAGQQNAVMSSTFPERLPTERPGSQLPAVFYVQVSLTKQHTPGSKEIQQPGRGAAPQQCAGAALPRKVSLWLLWTRTR